MSYINKLSTNIKTNNNEYQTIRIEKETSTLGHYYTIDECKILLDKVKNHI